MKITDEQSEKAIAIRALIKSDAPENPEANLSYVDFSREVAKMLDGLDTFVSPDKMKATFDRAWKSFVKVWSEENRRIVLEILDGNTDLLDEIHNHPNAMKIAHRILMRARTEQGPMGIGMTVTKVDISDILIEEGIVEEGESDD